MLSDCMEECRYSDNQILSEGKNMKIDPTKNTVVCGDNLEWLNWIPDESVDLCYIDPPFFSNRNYEIIWGNGYEVRSFGDRFSGGIMHYIEWMRPKIKLIHKKLKSTGSFFLHCDWHASHRLRCLLDDEFDSNFINEIIWTYSAFKRKTAKNFPRKHDVIFYYRKSMTNFNFETQYKPHKQEYLKRWKKDEKGRLYRDDVNPTKGGKRIIYLDETEGEIVDSVWDDIPPVNPMARERLGYPTQKPEGLIKRIIKCASNENDIILDCFGGGGTTAKVCSDLNRKFITGDVSPVAVKIIAERLNIQCPSIKYEIKNLPQTINDFQNIEGHKFADIICDLMGWSVNSKKSNDMGIDGWDGNDNPVQIKNHAKTKAGRPDMQKFYSAIVKSKKKKGIFVAWEFASSAKEFVAEMKQEHGIEIILMNCSDIFGHLIIPHEEHEEIMNFYGERYPEAWKNHQHKKVS